ncbi:hypothetical protein C2G38_2254819 [Gigaspora rosea]|uniref:Uncharacterized protein n=1 Tax=Gigaspora rosea TaxID=44941 RepID=A0A397U3Y2_9GLOM|nr:hypothetical protein C2G38_2254819 [Gigaspora rosea]
MATTSNDMGDELLKNKFIDAFNMCINTTNTYTLEDLENSLNIKQDTALKFRGKFNFIMGKWIEAFNKCNDATNTYTLEDLENSLKIKQDTALKFREKLNFIMGSYEIIDLTKLLDVEPNSKFALRYRAEAYYLTKRYKEAIIDLTKLLDIEPNNKFALRYLEDTYHLTKEAIIDLAKLLGIEPSDDIDESLKKKFIDAFNMCNNVTNTYKLKI